MDIPCYELSDDDSLPEQLENINNVKLITLRNRPRYNAYGKETFNLLERAIIEIKHDNEDDVEDTQENKLIRAERYTGLHRNVIEKLCKGPIDINTIENIDRKLIHDELMKYYLDLGVMPTTTGLFNSLQNYLPPYVDIRSFRDELVKMGYIFKKSETGTVVTENPAVRFERYMYLKKIKEYREEDKPIYFICEGAVCNDRIQNIDELERAPDSNTKNRITYIVSTNKIICKKLFEENESLEKYISDSVLDLDVDGVVVLDNSKSHNENFCNIPNENSLRCDMVRWLEYHQIPFMNSMPRFELWLLIEKFTDTNSNMSKIDNLIKRYGLEVLRIPNCINNVTPASYVHECLKKIIYPVSSENIVKKVTKAMILVERQLPRILSAIEAEESRLLDLEIKIENVIDSLTASTAVEMDECLPSLSED